MFFFLLILNLLVIKIILKLKFFLIKSYKRKDPKDADETEMMENYFDALCLALEEPEIKQKFLEEEGVELMLIMMK